MGLSFLAVFHDTLGIAVSMSKRQDALLKLHGLRTNNQNHFSLGLPRRFGAGTRLFLANIKAFEAQNVISFVRRTGYIDSVVSL